MRARIQTIPTGGGGGGGGGSNCFSREVRTSFSSRKQMATYDFHGAVRTTCPLCLRPYQSFKQFGFTFYFLFFARPGQFTKRLLIISADAKGKDSMIFFKIRETAHINSGHVLLSFRLHVMMALTQENVHYTLNSGPGVMNKSSNRVHARIQEFLSGGGGGGGGGGGVEARRPENSLDNVFLVINLF